MRIIKSEKEPYVKPGIIPLEIITEDIIAESGAGNEGFEDDEPFVWPAKELKDPIKLNPLDL